MDTLASTPWIQAVWFSHGGLHQRLIGGLNRVRSNLRDSIPARDEIMDMNDLNFVFLQNNCFDCPSAFST